jgi:hypothetical protein
MEGSWHDINDPGFFEPAEDTDPKNQEYATDNLEQMQDADTQEVRLSDPQFVESDDGFDFNRKCRVRVKVEYLKETARKKVTFSLFSTYNGEIQDMQCNAEGFESGGVAEAELTLYYNDAHYADYSNDPSKTLDYFFKASHSRGNEVESPPLTMPCADKGPIWIRVDLTPDDAINETRVLHFFSKATEYDQKQPIKDFVEDDDVSVLLKFSDVPMSDTITYSLEAIGDDGQTQLIFENTRYSDIQSTEQLT